ncbi:hypothetical protein EFK50_07430 [Nocardioides marmoriginsengisoli]|uniref:DUF3592 domain-containing protein n=1 Tax=Nocardioides marmoriginsengisoli TaxID=661483 RepID=A0A3N0CLR9_9ACTN|nr:hypothetical protein [Nocardioides marmoriginsengisoli]RNL64350.1 hypothetical protein EFK50_07430 [Nocardioides marmoriginsengisoli]
MLRGQLGNQRLLMIGTTALIALGAAAVFAGATGSMLVDEMRHGVIDSIFDDRRALAERHPYLLPAGVIAAVLGGLAGLPLYTWAITRYRGGERPWLLPAPVAVLGFTAGFIAVVPAWTGPLKVGTRVDPTFHHDRDWGWASWVAYAAPVWVPVLLLAGSALTVRWAVQSARARAASVRERDRLLLHGARVAGEVTEVRVHLSSDDTGSSRPAGATVTVRYPDSEGQNRWVTRYTRSTDLRVGAGAVEVLFDPLRPDEESSIFVAFQREPLAADWIGAKSR